MSFTGCCGFLQILPVQGWRLVSSANVSAKYHVRSGRLDRERSDQLHTWILLHSSQVEPFSTHGYCYIVARYIPTATHMDTATVHSRQYRALQLHTWILPHSSQVEPYTL